MATLVSPGVSITVIDESISTGAGPGTTPLIFIVTGQDKPTPDGTGVAEGTLAQNAGKLWLITSQRELLQTFGEPKFLEVGGNAIHGSPLNEYGLLAAHSYLGIANRVFVVRAPLNTTELQPSPIEPTSPMPYGTVWLNTGDTEFGLFVATSDGPYPTWEQVSISHIFELDNGIPPSPSIGNDGEYGMILVSDTTTGNKWIEYWFKDPTNGWEQVGSKTTDSYIVNPIYPAVRPDGTNVITGDYWVKNSAGQGGANYDVSVLSPETGHYVKYSAPMFYNDGTNTSEYYANQYYGSELSVGDFYVHAVYDPNTHLNEVAVFQLRRWDGTQWVQVNDFYIGDTEPMQGPTDGQLWYNLDVGVDLNNQPTVDLLINNGTGSWEPMDFIGDPGIPNPRVNPAYFLQSSDPRNEYTLIDRDIWIDTDQLNDYPVIYRWSQTSNSWIKIDNTDQTTVNGIIFADARPDRSYVRPSTVSSDYNNGGVDLDVDRPDPDMYPMGMILWNTRYSTMNVKKWNANHVIGYDTNNNPVYDGRWVNESGNYEDGSPKMGIEAQRSVIVSALQRAISENEDIRSDAIFYNLIACPGFPELIDEMVSLNVDRRETAFTIGDTPFDLKPKGTDLIAWSTNANNVSSNGRDGLLTSDPYLGVYYPSGLSTNIDGMEVMVPPSHMVLRVMAYNDNVAYPWFAPAGTTRGRVTNATSVGYLTDEGEYQPVVLNQGLRDVLYVNKINPIAFIPNEGLIVHGQKTRYPFESAIDRVNVARLINFIRYQAERIARPFLFEPNDQQTRNSVKDAFDRFLAELITLRGLSDFLVVCDESNNTPTRIDRNELWVDIAIVPTRAIEFIYIPIRIANTGADLAANIGNTV